MVCRKFGKRRHAGIIHNDRITLRMSGTAVISIDHGHKFLIRILLCHGTAHHIGAAASPVHIHRKICDRCLASVRHDLLLDDQAGCLSKPRFRHPCGGINAFDLGRLHLHIAVLVHVDDGGRI